MIAGCLNVTQRQVMLNVDKLLKLTKTFPAAT